MDDNKLSFKFPFIGLKCKCLLELFVCTGAACVRSGCMHDVSTEGDACNGCNIDPCVAPCEEKENKEEEEEGGGGEEEEEEEEEYLCCIVFFFLGARGGDIAAGTEAETTAGEGATPERTSAGGTAVAGKRGTIGLVTLVKLCNEVND